MLSDSGRGESSLAEGEPMSSNNPSNPRTKPPEVRTRNPLTAEERAGRGGRNGGTRRVISVDGTDVGITVTRYHRGPKTQGEGKSYDVILLPRTSNEPFEYLTFHKDSLESVVGDMVGRVMAGTYIVPGYLTEPYIRALMVKDNTKLPGASRARQSHRSSRVGIPEAVRTAIKRIVDDFEIDPVVLTMPELVKWIEKTNFDVLALEEAAQRFPSSTSPT
jgi:hypothetical protein